MRQAAKAASDHKREEYLAAALSALVITGVVASKLVANLEGKKAAAQGRARKKRKTEGKIINTFHIDSGRGADYRDHLGCGATHLAWSG